MNPTPSTSFIGLDSRRHTTSGKKALYLFAGLALVALVGFVAFRAGGQSFADGHKFFLQDHDEIEKAWQDFKAKYKRTYLSSGEHDYRFEIFASTYKLNEEMNANPAHTFKVGINRFSDITLEEFKERYSSPRTVSKAKSSPSAPVTTKGLTEDINWVKNLVPVKNQGECGCCYIFAANAALEAAHNRKNSANINLSEQYPLTSTNARTNSIFGCDGGDSNDVYDFYVTNGVMVTDVCPYTSNENDKCDPSKKDLNLAKVKGSLVIPFQSNSEQTAPPATTDQILSQLAVTPVVIGISSTNDAFKNYVSGIINFQANPGAVDHAVVIVGFSSAKSAMNNQNQAVTLDRGFYTIRNSWAADWGEQGYFRAEATDAGTGTLGLNDQPEAPVLA